MSLFSMVGFSNSMLVKDCGAQLLTVLGPHLPMLFTHSWDSGWQGARACPYAGGPAHLTSGTHCSSEIPYLQFGLL